MYLASCCRTIVVVSGIRCVTSRWLFPFVVVFQIVQRRAKVRLAETQSFTFFHPLPVAKVVCLQRTFLGSRFFTRQLPLSKYLFEVVDESI